MRIFNQSLRKIWICLPFIFLLSSCFTITDEDREISPQEIKAALEKRIRAIKIIDEIIKSNKDVALLETHKWGEPIFPEYYQEQKLDLIQTISVQFILNDGKEESFLIYLLTYKYIKNSSCKFYSSLGQFEIKRHNLPVSFKSSIELPIYGLKTPIWSMECKGEADGRKYVAKSLFKPVMYNKKAMVFTGTTEAPKYIVFYPEKKTIKNVSP